MKTETPRTTALIADIVQNPGLEWTRAEVEQLGEHAFQLERELNTALADLHFRRELYKLIEKDRDRLKLQRDTLWSLADGAKTLVEIMHTTPIEVYNREVWKPNWLKTFRMVSDEMQSEAAMPNDKLKHGEETVQ
jgi:hypothetical protein